MSLLEEFIQYLLEQVRNHSIYVWGAQGQTTSIVNEAWIRSREKTTGGYSSPKQTYADAAVEFFKKQIANGFANVLRAFDCSGLGMYWLYNLKKIFSSDMSANSMWGKCSTKLTRTTWKKGDWVFRGTVSNKTHIGYIVDVKGNIVEAQGRRTGVCMTNVSTKTSSGAYYWEYFARPDIFKKEIESAVTEIVNATEVEVIGGTVNVRDADGQTGKAILVAKKGDTFAYKGTAPSGWYKIEVPTTSILYISNKSDLTKLK